jgi:hypothetical protein
MSDNKMIILLTKWSMYWNFSFGCVFTWRGDNLSLRYPFTLLKGQVWLPYKNHRCEVMWIRHGYFI